MKMSYFIQHGWFVARTRYIIPFFRIWRKLWFGFFGMQIGAGSSLPRIFVTWPHQVKIGNRCKIEPGVYFKYSGIWKPGPSIKIGSGSFLGLGCEFNIRKAIQIGENCLIASGCRFIDHDHGISGSELIRIQPSVEAPIKIGNNVWLGCNVVVLKGVEIEDGAVVAAGAVVSKSILKNEIWGGVPARKISERH